MKAVQKRQTPEKNWPTFFIRRIFCSAESFDEAKEKLAIALRNSDVDDKYSNQQDKSGRKDRRKKTLMFSETSNNSSSDDGTVIKKDKRQYLKIKDFPTPPSLTTDGALNGPSTPIELSEYSSPLTNTSLNGITTKINEEALDGYEQDRDNYDSNDKSTKSPAQSSVLLIEE